MRNKFLKSSLLSAFAVLNLQGCQSIPITSIIDAALESNKADIERKYPGHKDYLVYKETEKRKLSKKGQEKSAHEAQIESIRKEHEETEK